MASQSDKKDSTEELKCHVSDMIKLALRTRTRRFSHFVDDSEQMFLKDMQNYSKDVVFTYYGGFENSVRRILCVSDEVLGKPETFDYPLTVLTIRGGFSSRFAKSSKNTVAGIQDNKTIKTEKTITASDFDIGHRDVLGSLMGLDISRSAIGDIVFGADDSGKKIIQVACENSVAGLIVSELASISKYKVSVSEEGVILNMQQRFDRIPGTAASLRADAVVKQAVNLSRDKAGALIKKGALKVNSKVWQSPDKEMHEGDIFSVSGFGKFRLSSADGLTKKAE